MICFTNRLKLLRLIFKETLDYVFQGGRRGSLKILIETQKRLEDFSRSCWVRRHLRKCVSSMTYCHRNRFLKIYKSVDYQLVRNIECWVIFKWAIVEISKTIHSNKNFLGDIHYRTLSISWCPTLKRTSIVIIYWGIGTILKTC